MLLAQTQSYRVCYIAFLLEYKSHYIGTQGHQSSVWLGTVNVLAQREDLVNFNGKICFLLHPCSSKPHSRGQYSDMGPWWSLSYYMAIHCLMDGE